MSKAKPTKSQSQVTIPPDQRSLKPRRQRFPESFKCDGQCGSWTHEGYTFQTAAQAVGVSSKSLRDWHKQRTARAAASACSDASIDQLQDEVRRLQKQLRRAELEREILKKSDGLLREGVVMRYRWIKQHRDVFPVAVMCDVLEVSDSGYYDWGKRKPGFRAQRTQKIRDDVRDAFEQSGGIYGSRKIVEALEKQDALTSACRNTVAQTMREMGLRSCSAKAFKPTTTQVDPTKIPAPNVLDQDFQARRPRSEVGTDITYLSTDAGWVYLGVVVDLFSRKVVGWAIGTSLATDLVAQALRQAIESRRPGPGLNPPLGSRQSIHQRSVPSDLAWSWHHGEHEPQGLLLRQRGVRAVLLVAQARVDQSSVIRRLGRHTPKRVPVHRSVLQSNTITPGSGVRLPRGLRNRTRPGNEVA